jgi:CheY-like chemotaxis protein
MANILLSDPDERSRATTAALIEALGHRVVDEPGSGPLAAAVIEPASPEALRLVERARARGRDVPVVCVSARRRGAVAMRLDPVAYLDKRVPVGPLVRAIAVAVSGRRLERRQPITA